MAITTVDGALAGFRPAEKILKAVTGTLVAGRPHSLFYLAGIPGAAVAPIAPILNFAAGSRRSGDGVCRAWSQPGTCSRVVVCG